MYGDSVAGAGGGLDGPVIGAIEHLGEALYDNGGAIREGDIHRLDFHIGGPADEGHGAVVEGFADLWIVDADGGACRCGCISCWCCWCGCDGGGDCV